VNVPIYLSNKTITESDYTKFEDLASKIFEFNLKFEDLGNHFTHRQLQYWYKEGLLTANPKTDKLSKIDFVDYCWIQTVSQLRAFGLSIEDVRNIKSAVMQPLNWLALMKQFGDLEKLLEFMSNDERKDIIANITATYQNKENANVQFSIFFIKILECLVYRQPLSLIFSIDKNVFFYNDAWEQDYRRFPAYDKILNSSYLKVSLSDIMIDFFKSTQINYQQKRVNLLTDKEAEILAAIRNDDPKEITIRFAKGEPVLLEVTKTKTVDVSARVIELIMTKSYEDISIKTQNGQVVYYENTVKKKLEGTL